MSTDILDDLKTLHTHAIDARHGYEEALHDAEGRGMTPLFREMIALHTTNAGELASVLARFGELPDESGSFMSTVHRTIISLRSLFGGLDASVLPGLVDGEKRNVSAYVKVLTRQDFERRFGSFWRSRSTAWTPQSSAWMQWRPQFPANLLAVGQSRRSHRPPPGHLPGRPGAVGRRLWRPSSSSAQGGRDLAC